MKRAVLALCLLMSMGIGCGEDLNQPSYPATEDLNIPGRVMITDLTIGDQMVLLDWDDQQHASDYLVFRDQGEGSDEILAGTVSTSEFEDITVLNDRLYRYRVAGRSASELEGERGDRVSAVPALFSVMVNNNAQVTSDPILTLDLGAPSSTPSMRVGETPDDPAASWQPFTDQLLWTVAGDDGLKEVWVEFRDIFGNISEPVFDSILLDRSTLFSIVINDNSAATSDPALNLRLGAPAATQSMRIGNTQGDPSASWQPFSSELLWSVPEGDGVKEVWVEFRDAQGNLSQAVADSILLDTTARVIDLDATPTYIDTPWSIMTFYLYANETGGQAVVEVPALAQIQLYDDGTVPDAVAGDNLYTGFWVVPPGIEADEIAVTGQFTDWLGNVSPSFPLGETLSIHTGN